MEGQLSGQLEVCLYSPLRWSGTSQGDYIFVLLYSFFSDPDQAVFLNADPDLALFFNANPDPALKTL